MPTPTNALEEVTETERMIDSNYIVENLHRGPNLATRILKRGGAMWENRRFEVPPNHCVVVLHNYHYFNQKGKDLLESGISVENIPDDYKMRKAELIGPTRKKRWKRWNTNRILLSMEDHHLDPDPRQVFPANYLKFPVTLYADPKIDWRIINPIKFSQNFAGKIITNQPGWQKTLQDSLRGKIHDTVRQYVSKYDFPQVTGVHMGSHAISSTQQNMLSRWGIEIDYTLEGFQVPEADTGKLIDIVSSQRNIDQFLIEAEKLREFTDKHVLNQIFFEMLDRFNMVRKTP